MAVPPRRWAAELLHVWFHELLPRDWFGSSAEVDAMLRRKFAPDHRALSRRPAAEFLSDLRLAQAGSTRSRAMFSAILPALLPPIR